MYAPFLLECSEFRPPRNRPETLSTRTGAGSLDQGGHWLLPGCVTTARPVRLGSGRGLRRFRPEGLIQTLERIGEVPCRSVWSDRARETPILVGTCGPPAGVIGAGLTLLDRIP